MKMIKMPKAPNLKLNTAKKPVWIALAPMDGITDYSFRKVMRFLHPNIITYSEFINVKKLLDKNHAKLMFDERDNPFFVQIFGNEPKDFAKAANYLSRLKVSGIDINMGCSNRKIASSQHGAFLMQDTKKACQIINACKKETDLPITVKTRLGWEDEHNLVNFVNKMAENGLDMITVHGRTYRQKFKGNAYWRPIYRLKKAVEIKVIGNGDVVSYEDGFKKLKNLNGFMVGRQALNDPWVFYTKKQKNKVTAKDRLNTLAKHFKIKTSYQPPKDALLQIRKYLKGYLEGVDDALGLKNQLMQATTTDLFIKIIDKKINQLT